jgi:hypothetical protein
MKNEFIPYEQALALKGLGFDEPCLAYYHEDGILINYPQMSKNKGLMTILNRCSAPLKSQAFRWFREKYGLNYKIEEVSQVRFQARVYKGDGWATWDFGYKFNTYEEAELACLKKLIELLTPTQL